MSIINEKLPPSQLEVQISGRIVQIEKNLEIAKSRFNELMKNPQKGYVRITRKGNKYHCVYYDDSKQKQGKYLKKSQLSVAKKIVESAYLKKLIVKLSLEQRVLIHTRKLLYKAKLPQLSHARSLLVEPVTYSDKVFTELWQSNKVAGPKRVSEYITPKGVVVCSKSELIIASTLEARNIPYHYERPLHLEGFTLHPDFLCLNPRTHQEFIWEHLGMMDDSSYSSKVATRLKLYTRNGFTIGKNLLLSVETKAEHLGTAEINQIIENFLV